MYIFKLRYFLLLFIYISSSINLESQNQTSTPSINAYIEFGDFADNYDYPDNEDWELEEYYEEPCPDSLVYGNINAKNYVIMRNEDKVRKLYFDEISLSIINNDVSLIHTPGFRDEDAIVGNRLSFRIENGLNYEGENYLRHFGIVAHNIDCFKIPDEIGSIFSEDNVILSNFREEGDSRFVDAEITMITGKHNQSLIAYFYDIIIEEKNFDKTELNAVLHINNEAQKINSGKLHYHSNPSPSPMGDRGLVIELDSDTLNLFRFNNFEVSTGDYINYQYLYRITDVNDKNISLKVFSFPANEAKKAIESSFFPDAEADIMQKFTTPDKLTLVLEIENAPYTRDLSLKGYSYNKYRALENNMHDVAYYDEVATSDDITFQDYEVLNLNTDYNKYIINQMERTEYKEWIESNADGYVLTSWYGEMEVEEDNNATADVQVDCQSVFQGFEKKTQELGINLREQDMNPFENEELYKLFIDIIKAANGGIEMFKGFSTFEEDLRIWQEKYCEEARKREPREPYIKRIQLDKNGNPLKKDYSDYFRHGSLIAKYKNDKIIWEASNEQQGKETYEFDVPEGTIDLMQIGMAVASIEPKVGTENIIHISHTEFTTSHSASSSYEWNADSDNDETIHVKTITRGRIYPKVSQAILSVRNLNETELSLSDKISDDLVAVDVKINTNIDGLIIMRSIYFSPYDKNEYETVRTYLINKNNQIMALTNPDYDFFFVN